MGLESVRPNVVRKSRNTAGDNASSDASDGVRESTPVSKLGPFKVFKGSVLVQTVGRCLPIRSVGLEWQIVGTAAVVF
ncbi:hypothetical protein PTKU64_91040 (plasmid) [Paraburkholderia terrae]|uniref:Uncharacterized protein n=1 Tax=Paraburkholderia terrae TaxID=311230 RepID=A0ABM7U2C5_9BURK|nr:hypothetical protein PTKU64_91040 [Paraburkholderia terrae]